MRVLPSDISTILTSITITQFVQSACTVPAFCSVTSCFSFCYVWVFLQILFHCIYLVQLADGPFSGFCLCSGFYVHHIAF